MPTSAEDGPSAADIGDWQSCREAFGFQSSRDFVRELAFSSDVDVTSYGLPLTEAEVRALDRRVEVQAASTEWVDYVEAHQRAFGGIYFDNDRDAFVILAVEGRPAANREEWNRLVPPGANALTRQAKFSLETLRAEFERLDSKLAKLANSGPPLVSWGIDEPKGAIVVTMSDATAADVSRVESLAGEVPVEVREGEPFRSTACSRTGACSPLRGGIAIKSSDWLCSAAFVAKLGGSRYLMSAGHCDKGAGPNYRLNNGTLIGTGSFADWANGTRADSLSIAISNPSTDNLRYVSEALGTRDMTAKRSNAQQLNGNTVCKSARSGYTCGVINGREQTVNTEDGNRTHQWLANWGSPGGDSGGAVFSGSSWFGIIGSSAGGNTAYATVDNVEFVQEVTTCTSASC
jgi:hypothetical protein